MTALVFERLGVRRMPGIRDGGFELDAISPGLNLVHGPNGSGKTTTARAIEALLWPQHAAPREAWLRAALRRGPEPWTAEIDGNSARYQRDGADAEALALPPPEARDRYRLSLHELLAADDAGFAAAIARESAGGYDLEAAAQLLKPRRAASPCRRELEALAAARQKLDEARALEAALRDDERELHDLRSRLEGRDALAARIHRLERAVEFARARAEHAAAEREYALFDARRERLHGDEVERLRELEARLAGRTAEAATAHAERARARTDLAACGVPEGGLPGTLLPALRTELEALREVARTIDTRRQELAAAEQECERQLAAIGGTVDETRLELIDTVGVAEAAALARAGETLAAERAALAAEVDALAAPPQPGADRQALERGVHLLRRWLRGSDGDPGEARRLRTLGAAAAGLLVAAGAALGLIAPVLAGAALVGVGLLIAIMRRRAPVDLRAAHRAEYERLALEQPTGWTAEAVEPLLGRLEESVSAARLEEARALRRADAERRLAVLEPRLAEHQARRAVLTERLGVELEAPGGAVVWLVERIGRWHDARARADGAAAALTEAQRQLTELSARATERVAAFTDGTAPLDASALAGVIADLEARQAAHRDAAARLAQSDATLERAGREIAEANAARQALLARLGVAEAEVALLDPWCADHARFRQARERLQLAASIVAEKAARLAELPGHDAALLCDAEDVLATRLESARAEARGLAALHDRAVEIRTRIEQAKRSHAVEDALAEVERAEAALAAVRERDRRAALAAALLDFVRGATRDQHLPAVFHRARALFAQITHGRYRLDFDDGEPVAFRAFDTTTGTGHALGELSSASRIQLLLAVRLAFVEVQESGVRLPLLLDETLGNSDDARARAIMEAVLELAAAGRQIFYFTAQPDEVGKWRALLESRADVPHAVIDLAAARGLERRLDFSGLRIVAAPRAKIPAPEELDHADYGHRLGVPALGRHEGVEAAHLWYLLDEPDVLHEVLRTLGVARWGELRALLAYGNATLDAALIARTEARARALAHALDLCRLGHGRPVDRAALVASGAVTETFLDRLAELCAAVGGDARRLIEAIDQREVRGFRTKARDDLHDFLEEHGYLDAHEPLDVEAIRTQTLVAAAADLAAGTLTPACVDGLLARLHAALPAAAV